MLAMNDERASEREMVHCLYVVVEEVTINRAPLAACSYHCYDLLPLSISYLLLPATSTHHCHFFAPLLSDDCEHGRHSVLYMYVIFYYSVAT